MWSVGLFCLFVFPALDSLQQRISSGRIKKLEAFFIPFNTGHYLKKNMSLLGCHLITVNKCYHKPTLAIGMSHKFFWNLKYLCPHSYVTVYWLHWQWEFTWTFTIPCFGQGLCVGSGLSGTSRIQWWHVANAPSSLSLRHNSLDTKNCHPPSRRLAWFKTYLWAIRSSIWAFPLRSVAELNSFIG